MVGARDSGSSLSADREDCVVFLGEKRYSYSAYLRPDV